MSWWNVPDMMISYKSYIITLNYCAMILWFWGKTLMIWSQFYQRAFSKTKASLWTYPPWWYHFHVGDVVCGDAASPLLPESSPPLVWWYYLATLRGITFRVWYWPWPIWWVLHPHLSCSLFYWMPDVCCLADCPEHIEMMSITTS